MVVAVEEYAVVVAPVEASYRAAVASPAAAGEVVPSEVVPSGFVPSLTLAVAAVAVIDGAEGAGTVVVADR